MSADVIRFPARSTDTGMTYVVTCTDAGRAYVYRQARDEAEPTLRGEFEHLPYAVEFGRQIARENRDRFVVDEGVPQ